MRGYVLITGAAGGLGKSFAAECAARGWNLFLTDISEPSLAALAMGMERLYGVTVRYRTCDLTDDKARMSFWQHIAHQGLRFHMLINVAGLDHEGWFSERQVDELRSILRVNIEATVEMTQRVLGFREPGEALRIITVSSLAAFYPMPIKAVYAASKRFLLDWSLALQEELRSSGVSITVLCPAGMRTNAACIQAIDAQGLMGQVTTLDVGYITARTVEYALVGRRIFIPGLVNQIVRAVSSIVPSALITTLIGRRWGKRHANVPARAALTMQLPSGLA